MMTRLLKSQRLKVERLSFNVEHNRLVMRELGREGHNALGNKMRGGWPLLGCFAAGLLAARWGGSVGRRLKTIPLATLVRHLLADLFI